MNPKSGANNRPPTSSRVESENEAEDMDEGESGMSEEEDEQEEGGEEQTQDQEVESSEDDQEEEEEDSSGIKKELLVKVGICSFLCYLCNDLIMI